MAANNIFFISLSIPSSTMSQIPVETTTYDTSIYEAEKELVLDIKGSIIGLVFLNVSTQTLSLLENTECPSAIASAMIFSFIEQLQPTRVFISSRLPVNIIDELSQTSEQYDFRMSIRGSLDFATVKLKAHLEQIKASIVDLVEIRKFSILENSMIQSVETLVAV